MVMTDAELSILSLVAEGPRYGYELQQIIDERGIREWLTIGFSSIYYILNKLEQQKLLTGMLYPEGRGPARKVYEITDAGRGVLQTAIAELLREPRALGSGFELGLANLGALKPAHVYRVLRHHQADLKIRLDTVRHAWGRHQEENHGDDHIRALYTHSIAMMQAELEWMAVFLDDWKERYPGVEQKLTPETGPLAGDSHRAVTQANRQTMSSDPAKMIQRLKRIPPKKPGE
ncbi:MAG: helix-turn-helix transcriptional regulator [Anaerolineaceae bacterium]|nr:helix-turn-helix transcriptional regulator [Anaerolineaceae bacterium]